MDPPVPLDFHEKWTKEKESIIAKHEKELAFHEDLLEKEKQEVRESSERDLLKVKAAVPPTLYREIILPMAEKSLKNDMRQIYESYQKRTAIIEKEQKAERARHEIAYYEEQKVKLAINGERNTHTGIKGSLTSQSQDVSTQPACMERDQRVPWKSFEPRNRSQADDSLTCTVQRETIRGEKRLLMRVQSRKRKAPISKEETPKRLRIEESTNYPQTPAVALLDENAHSPARTITFDEVYQNGNAKHKDTIIEWPNGSKKWYILKCEKHEARFTKNAVQGAARHLNGLSHGFPDRNRDTAVKTLGYLVVDCNEKLAKLNNKAADEAYASGYKPPLAKTKEQSRKRDRIQKRTDKKRIESSPSKWIVKLGPESTPKKSEVRDRQISDTPTSRRTSSQKLITNPKTFKIYHGRWKSNSGTEDNKEIYPVMILGWDSQDGSGLKNTTLDATGLLNKGSFPPNCYVYESNKIVGWARGYEDGGAKVDSRKFPVMFFDEFQTVAWLPARCLTKFPLYNRTPPPELDHPFNAARRWIAEREGFSTWEEREQARLHSSVSRLPSMSPVTPNGDESTDATNKLGGRENRESLPTTTNTDSTVDKDDSESISSNSEAISISTANTEMLVEEWREKGGEIPGDDDYSVSGSDTENTVEPGMEDWDKLFSHAAEPNSSPDRPWAFYSLRSIENNEELNNTDDAAQEPGEKQPSISTATETGSALGPARWTSSYTVNSRESPESHTLEMLEASHGIQHPGQLDNQHPRDGAASASQPECVSSTLSESTLASIIDNIIATPTAGLKRSKVYIVSRDVDGDKGISSLSCGTPNEVMPKASDNVRPNPCGNTKALNSNEMSGSDSRRDDIRSGDEIRVAGEGLVENGQPTAKEIVQVIQKEDKNNAKELNETQLFVNEATTSSTNPPAATTPPISARSIRNPFANATTSPGSAEFELSQCSNGEMSWERSSAEEDCIKLFYDKDQKILASWQGPVDVTIELMEIVSFSRESIPGLEGNSILVLNNKDSSSWKLVLNQSKGSTLPTGMIQSRRFIRQLRNANPDITCLEKV